MTWRFFPAIMVFIAVSCSPDQRASVPIDRQRTVRDHTHSVRTIHPSDTSFQDLEFFKAFVGDARIVLLGEQSHGDGSTFLAKTRLIRFLHRELGFSVLAFESGMFESELANRFITQGMPVRQALGNSLFDLWTQSRQFQPLLEYLQQNQNGNTPIEVTGFDMQMSNVWGRDSLLPAMKQTIPRWLGNDTRAFLIVSSFLDTLKRSPKKFHDIDSLRQTVFFTSLNDIIRSLSAVNDTGDDRQYWIQQFKSLRTYIRFLWTMDVNTPDPAVFNLRDKQMAQNLLWLSHNRYAGRKIIVWAAASHISRNRQEIAGRQNADSAMVPMGHHVWEALRDSIRIVGFTAYEGRVGVRGRNPWDLARAKPGTLEDLIHSLGHEHAFLDLRSVPAGSWLRDTVHARPYGYVVMNARWAEMMDGIFYTNTMIPSDNVREE